VGKVEIEIENLAKFFKALGHPVRLLILYLVRDKPRHGEELASILSLNPATISHHLAILTQAGLVTPKKDQYYQVFSFNRNMLDRTLAEAIFSSKNGLPDMVEEDAYRKKVLAAFFYRGRLRSIPTQLKKRHVILNKISEAFETDRDYS
jgi:ArsR family transcriptional regulator